MLHVARMSRLMDAVWHDRISLPFRGPRMSVIASIEPSAAAVSSGKVEQLLRERSTLEDELARINREADGPAEIDRAIESIDNELGALGRVNQAALAEWARNGANGPAPAPDDARRHALETRRALLMNDRAAAETRQSAVLGLAADLSRRLGDINFQIRCCRVNQLLDEARIINEELSDRARKLRERWQTMMAIGIALTDRLADAAQAGDARSHNVLQTAKQSFDQIEAPVLTYDLNQVQRLAAPWREMIA